MIEGAKNGIFIGRDLLGKIGIVIKFKPWQVTKLARFAPAASGILTLLTSIYEAYEIQQRNEQLAKLKDDLHSYVERVIKETRDSLGGEEFYKNYAPHIPELEKAIAEGRAEIGNMEENMRALAAWQLDAEALLQKIQTP